MALISGACRFDLWWVHVDWSDDCVHRVSFSKSGEEGPVPPALRAYCAGTLRETLSLSSVATKDTAPYAAVYRAVCRIPYGQTATYGQIALECGTFPRAIGMAMRRNPTPLVFPVTVLWQRTDLVGLRLTFQSNMPFLRWNRRIDRMLNVNSKVLI